MSRPGSHQSQDLGQASRRKAQVRHASLPRQARALVSNTTPHLLRLGVVHDVGVVDRRLPLRDLPRLALTLRLHVLRLRHSWELVKPPLCSVGLQVWIAVYTASGLHAK